MNLNIEQIELSEFSVSEKAVRRKINTLKQNKSAGPDNIKPKLLKLARQMSLNKSNSSIKDRIGKIT